MINNLIETFNLSKVYKLKDGKTEIVALNNINLSVKEGEIFGLLGPNGAGKTTLIQILTTIKTPSTGYATIDGINILKNPDQAKAKISLMLESDMLYYRITGYDNLKFFCKIYKVPNYKEKIIKLAKEFGLEKWLNQYVESFSTGMKMKLALCRTLLINRKILFLDEPTVGLDVQTRDFIINKLKALNSTIFLTSHDMRVVEKICNRIAFINRGNILKIGSKEDIKDLVHNEILIDINISENKHQLKSELLHENFITTIEENKDGLIIGIKDRDSYKDLFKILSNYKVLMIKEQDPSLEDLFLKLI